MVEHAGSTVSRALLALRVAASVLPCPIFSSCTEAFRGGDPQPTLVEADTPFGAVPLNSPEPSGSSGNLANPPGNLTGGSRAPAARASRDGIYRGTAQVLDSGGGLCPETQEISGLRVSGTTASYGGYTGTIGPDGSVTMYYGRSTIAGQFSGPTFRGQLDVPGRFGALGCSYLLNLQQAGA